MPSTYFQKILLLANLIWLGALQVKGQEQDLHVVVKNLFQEEESVWYNYYIGNDNNLHQTIIITGHNQKEIHGIIYIKENNTLFKIASDFPNVKGTYVVTDLNDELWGNFTFIEKDSFSVGKMLSKNKNIALQFNVKKTSRNKMHLQDCPILQNYLSFSDDSIGINLILQTYTDGKTTGYYTSRINNQSYFLQGECTDVNCYELKLTAHDLSSSTKNKFTISIQENTLKTNAPKEKFYVTTLKKDISPGFLCKSVQTNSSVIGIYYPLIQHKEYLKWQQDYTQQWLLDHNSINIAEWDSLRSVNLQFEISGINSQFVSGNYYWTEPGFKKLVNYPFNYNLKSGSIIQLVDLFEKNSDYKSYINSQVDSTKKQIANSYSSNISNFIQKDAFSYWNLLPTGICFFSEFSPIYGRYKILIPYKNLEPYLKKSNFLKKFL
ncbi:MAG: hypothetical protein HOP11_12900 [Saprospiraceae bacterium]|nr:hypothetical protein [Saprospiraceae bacterium]